MKNKVNKYCLITTFQGKREQKKRPHRCRLEVRPHFLAPENGKIELVSPVPPVVFYRLERLFILLVFHFVLKNISLI